MKKIYNNFFARFNNNLDNMVIGSVWLKVIYCSLILVIVGVLSWVYYVNINVFCIIVSFIISFGVSFISGFLFRGYDNWFVRFVLRNFIFRGIITVCLITLFISVFVYCDLGIIYCDGVDSDTNDNSNNSNDNSNSNESNDNNNNSNNNSNMAKSSITINTKDNYKVEWEVDRELGKSMIENAGKVIGSKLDSIVGSLGAAAAAGTAAGAVGSNIVKSGLPPISKAVAVGALTGITAGSTYVAISTAKSLVENYEKNERLKHNADKDYIPSPTDDTFISSLNDYNILSPLEQLLDNQINVNLLLIITILLLLFVVFNKLFIKKGIFTFLKEKSKLNIKYKKYIDFFENFSEKYFITMFISILILTIFLLGLNLLISVELSKNIDDYIRVHNHLKDIKESIIMSLFYLKNNNRKINILSHFTAHRQVENKFIFLRSYVTNTIITNNSILDEDVLKKNNMTKNNNNNNDTIKNTDLSESQLEERIKNLKLDDTITIDKNNNLNLNDFKLSWDKEKVELENLLKSVKSGEISDDENDTISIQEKIFHGYFVTFNSNTSESSSDNGNFELNTNTLKIEDIKAEDCSPDTLSGFFSLLQESNSILGNEPLLNLLKNRINSEEVLDKYRKLYLDTIESPEKFNKIIELDGNILKINLEKSGEFVQKGFELLKNVEINTLITVSGTIVPTIGTFYLYKKVSNLFAKHLEDSLKSVLPYGTAAERSFQQIRNRKILALFNIAAMVIVGTLMTGFSTAIKKNIDFPINNTKVLPYGSSTSISSDLTTIPSFPGEMKGDIKDSQDLLDKKSLIPLFILNKFKNLPFKQIFTFLFIFSGYFLFNNSPELLNLFNLKYIYYLFKILDLYFISVIIESAIILYYWSCDNILENKIYKLLPNTLKNEILDSRQIENKTIITYYSKTILLGLINLILLIIGEGFFYLLFL